MNESHPTTPAEEVFLSNDEYISSLSRNLPTNATDITLGIAKKMEPYGGYTFMGLAIGAAHVHIEDMGVYNGMKQVQEQALEVDRLINLGAKWGINPSITSKYTELQAKIAKFPYDPSHPDEEHPVDDALVFEAWELAENLSNKNSNPIS